MAVGSSFNARPIDTIDFSTAGGDKVMAVLFARLEMLKDELCNPVLSEHDTLLKRGAIMEIRRLLQAVPVPPPLNRYDNVQFNKAGREA